MQQIFRCPRNRILVKLYFGCGPCHGLPLEIVAAAAAAAIVLCFKYDSLYYNRAFFGVTEVS